MKLDRGNLRTLLIVAGCLVAQPTAASLAAGSLVLLAGAALHLWSKACLRQNRELTTNGPYRWSRNPFYLANLLIDAGICIVIARWWIAAAYLPLWWWIYDGVIRREEAVLEGAFGERYRSWAARVPRLLPLRRPAEPDPDGPRPSWRNPNLASGKEYGRLAGILSAPLLIWAVRSIWTNGFGLLARFDSLEWAALALLASLRALQWALVRHFKEGRAVVPAFLQRAEALAGALVLFVLVLRAVELRATEWGAAISAGGALLLAVLILALVVAPFRTPAEARAWLAAACLSAGWLGGTPALGVLAAFYFALLAIDRVGHSDAERHPAPGRRAWVALTSGLLVIAAVL